jgi:hypothetical protein
MDYQLNMIDRSKFISIPVDRVAHARFLCVGLSYHHIWQILILKSGNED